MFIRCNNPNSNWFRSVANSDGRFLHRIARRPSKLANFLEKFATNAYSEVKDSSSIVPGTNCCMGHLMHFDEEAGSCLFAVWTAARGRMASQPVCRVLIVRFSERIPA
jgi:hypothetical protein